MLIRIELIRDLVQRSVAAAPGDGIADVLVGSGWSREASGSTPKREIWTNGGLKGFLRPSGAVPYFTVALDVHDPTEEDDLDSLIGQFESKFEDTTAKVAEWLGAADFESQDDEPGVVVPGEFVRAASWNRGARFIVIGFQYEDAEVPLRISLNIAVSGSA